MVKVVKAQASTEEKGLIESAGLPQVKAVGSPQRKIPGNLPYLTSPGTLKKVLERIIEASRPDKFNSDFLENVIQLKGGSARATIPILKRMGFLSSDGVPTDLYARFRSDSGRGPAALQALNNGFREIFKKSEWAHSVPDAKLRNIIVEITGLKPTEAVAMAIKGTFNVVKGFVPKGIESSYLGHDSSSGEPSDSEGQSGASHSSPQRQGPQPHGVGLVYNINIVLPETSDLRVLSAIFRSLKENLMQ